MVRLTAVVLAYNFGWVPQGNTGCANVASHRSMPIPEDLRPLLDGYSLVRNVVAQVFMAVLLVLLATLLAWSSFSCSGGKIQHDGSFRQLVTD